MTPKDNQEFADLCQRDPVLALATIRNLLALTNVNERLAVNLDDIIDLCAILASYHRKD